MNDESEHSNMSGDIHSFGLYFETLVSSESFLVLFDLANYLMG